MYSQYALSQYIPFCQKGKWGFSNTEGKITIPCLYEAVDIYSDDKLAKVKIGGKYGYINLKGITVIPFEYNDCDRIYEVIYKGMLRIVKRNSKILTDYKNDFDDLENNRYIVTKNNKNGVLRLIDDKPIVIVPINYLKIQFDPNKKIFLCSNSERIEYFDMSGNTINLEEISNINTTEYPSAKFDDSNENFESIEKTVYKDAKGKMGLIQKSKNSRNTYDTLMKATYDSIIIDENINFNEIVFVKKNRKWGIINIKKITLLPIKYDSINFDLSKDNRNWGPFQRIFVVNENGKWGMIGRKRDNEVILNTLIPFEYNAISKLYSNFMLLQKGDKFQVYNLEKYKFISPKFYNSITKYEDEAVNHLHLFQITNKLEQTVFLGENGVEFFED